MFIWDRDFRPINLVTSVYKILNKVLCRRLGNELDDTISANQSAFVGGNTFFDAALINEVLEDVRCSGHKFEVMYCEGLVWTFR